MLEKNEYNNNEGNPEEKENLLRENSQISDETTYSFKSDNSEEEKCITKIADGKEVVIISAESYQRLTKKKKTYKLTIFLDALFAMFLATPCVVGCWRGIWITMDLNHKYFPMYETYFFSMAIDMCFILFRKTLIKTFHKGSRTTCFIPFLKLAKYFYIYIFAVMCNMKWRATWLIIDYYTHIEYNEYGMALRTPYFLSIGTGVCSLLIILFKLLKNTLAVPFFIALDDKTEELFDFPTRFKSDVVCTAITIVKRDRTNLLKPMETNIETPTNIAEKLVAEESRRISVKKASPRPFLNHLKGPTPAHFTPTTEKPTTLRYPQLNEYRNRYQPKNIQDIISFISQNNEQPKYKEEQSQYYLDLERKNNFSTSFSLSDPFHLFKPQDPSDINLLATANVRFAPPIWSNNFKKGHQQQQQHQIGGLEVNNSNKKEIVKDDVRHQQKGKPIMVTLNIYPMDNDLFQNNHRYPQRPAAGYRIQNSDSRMKFGAKFNKMTIHLNVFPEDLIINNSEALQKNKARIGFNNNRNVTLH